MCVGKPGCTAAPCTLAETGTQGRGCWTELIAAKGRPGHEASVCKQDWLGLWWGRQRPPAQVCLTVTGLQGRRANPLATLSASRKTPPSAGSRSPSVGCVARPAHASLEQQLTQPAAPPTWDECHRRNKAQVQKDCSWTRERARRPGGHLVIYSPDSTAVRCPRLTITAGWKGHCAKGPP